MSNHRLPDELIFTATVVIPSPDEPLAQKAGVALSLEGRNDSTSLGALWVPQTTRFGTPNSPAELAGEAFLWWLLRRDYRGRIHSPKVLVMMEEARLDVLENHGRWKPWTINSLLKHVEASPRLVAEVERYLYPSKKLGLIERIRRFLQPLAARNEGLYYTFTQAPDSTDEKPRWILRRQAVSKVLVTV